MAHVQGGIFLFSFIYHVWIIFVTKHYENQNLFSVLQLIDLTKDFYILWGSYASKMLHYVYIYIYVHVCVVHFGDIFDSFRFKNNMVGCFVLASWLISLLTICHNNTIVMMFCYWWHSCYLHIDGILPKGPYPPCLRMADRAVLAEYPQYIIRLLMSDFILWALNINHSSYPFILGIGNPCHACDMKSIPNYSIFRSMQLEWLWQTYCISCLFDERQTDINTQYSWQVDRFQPLPMISKSKKNKFSYLCCQI